MFTGVVKDVGEVKSVEKKLDGVYFVIESLLSSGFKIGDSVAVNGVCQTVLSTNVIEDAFETGSFVVQAIPETLNVTNFGELKEGSAVNLEPALKLNDGIDGHLVQGHVDCMGNILDVVGMGNGEGKNKVQADEDGVCVQIEYPKSIDEFIVYKGSISVNGVSLTISKVGTLEGVKSDSSEYCNYFEVSLIKHTLENSNFGSLKIGDNVNLEIDMMARYASKMLGEKSRRS